MASFDRCIAFTLQAEGGWLEDPLDPERCTHMGITLEGWSVNLGRKCTLAELRAMTRGQAKQYYQTHYWNVMGCLELPARFGLEVFDFGVNAGPARSVQLLQRMLGVPQDGKVGPKTVAKACGTDAVTRSRLAALANIHEAYYRTLPGFAHDGRGWTATINTTRR